MRLWAEPDGYVIGGLVELNDLLAEHHYLGPVKSAGLVVVQWSDGAPVAGQAWRHPTSRHLPADGSWLELCRWVLTPEAGLNAGSRMHRYVARHLRLTAPGTTTMVSYSDPSAGHTGALYRACNWQAAPTWHALRPPPSGYGSWDGGVTRQAVKDRWVFCLRPDKRRGELLAVKDSALNPTGKGWAA